jgi:putative intracellular protease/amidase
MLIKHLLVIILVLMGLSNSYSATALKDDKAKKVLFVVTSHDKKGNTQEKTGYFLSEVSHPWNILNQAGYQIDFVSPKGGNAPVDGFDLNDSINKKFWEDSEAFKKITHTLTPQQVNADNYSAIYFAGGHGAMWDFPNDTALIDIAAKIYKNNGIIAAVCHGSAALINIKLSNDEYLIKHKKVSGFTNEEERLRNLDQVVPFLLEDELKTRGAIFEKVLPWQVNVSLDQRIITGQNPQSARLVGKNILIELQKNQ